MKTTYIDVIRHGEPAGGRVFRGHTDHPLTELGIKQFKQRVQRLGYRWDQIVSSPLKRCRQSAELLSNEQNLPLKIDEHFSEIHFGDWENMLVDKVMEQENISHMWNDPMNFCPPQGETTVALQQRVIKGWHKLLEDYQGQRVLVVTHGGVIRMLAQYLLEINRLALTKLSLPHAAIISFKVISTEYQGENQQWVSLEAMDGTEL